MEQNQPLTIQDNKPNPPSNPSSMIIKKTNFLFRAKKKPQKTIIHFRTTTQKAKKLNEQDKSTRPID
jgi:hypothetical protein